MQSIWGLPENNVEELCESLLLNSCADNDVTL